MAFYEEDTLPIVKTESVVGRGLSIDHTITPLGELNTSTGLSRILQSYFVILNYVEGTRFFNPRFGSKLKQIIFEPLDNVTKAKIEVFVKESCNTHEKRATVTKVEVLSQEDEGIVQLRIIFKPNDEEDQYSYIYKFVREPNELV